MGCLVCQGVETDCVCVAGVGQCRVGVVGWEWAGVGQCRVGVVG